MDELDIKLARLTDLMERHQLDGIVLQRISSFAWATCGAASYIALTTLNGVAWVYIERGSRWVITNNIEAARLEVEEPLHEQGWKFAVCPWHGYPDDELKKLTGGKRIGADGAYPAAVDLSEEMIDLRASLTPSEQERFRHLGKLCAAAMENTLFKIRPGMSEIEISGFLSGEAEKRGIRAVVNLVASDERIYKYRHPLPTEKRLERYAMIVLGGRWRGLICSVSRLVYFGKPPDEICQKMACTARVNAEYVASTRPGVSMGSVLQAGLDTYVRLGYPSEWQLHHQGGLSGYEPRELKVTPGTARIVQLGQAFAWNPTITGTKMEDTILVGADGNEILTRTPGLPVIPIACKGMIVNTPDILIAN